MDIKIDFDALTLGEIEEFEELAEVSISSALQEAQAGHIPARALTVLAFLFARRDDPAFTLEDARAVKAVNVQFGTREEAPAGDGADPTPPPDASGAA